MARMIVTREGSHAWIALSSLWSMCFVRSINLFKGYGQKWAIGGSTKKKRPTTELNWTAAVGVLYFSAHCGLIGCSSQIHESVRRSIQPHEYNSRICFFAKSLKFVSGVHSPHLSHSMRATHGARRHATALTSHIIRCRRNGERGGVGEILFVIVYFAAWVVSKRVSR